MARIAFEISINMRYVGGLADQLKKSAISNSFSPISMSKEAFGTEGV